MKNATKPAKLEIVERQNNALQKLNEIAALSDLSPKETLREALIVGKNYFGLEYAIVSHIIGEDYTVDVQSSPPDTLYDGQLFALGSTYCKTTLELDDVLAITDVTKSQYVGHPCHRDFALVSYIGAPVRINSHVYGTINFSSPNPRQLEYDEIDNEFMRLLGRWAGSFLERQSALDELSFAKKRFEMIFENNASGILVVDQNCQIVMANKRFCEIIGYSKDEMIGQVTKFLHNDETSYEALRQTFLTDQNVLHQKLEFVLTRKDHEQIHCEFFGSPIELSEKNIGIIWSILDITTQKDLQCKIEKQAITDYLTDLYNRRYFTGRMEEEIAKTKRNKHAKTSIMMFDLDKFKRVNDTMGHLAGDAVIKKFADIIKNNLRVSDIAGRIGGEEFALILPDTDIKSAAITAERIREEVSNTTVVYEGKFIHFTVSIGLTALSPLDLSADCVFSRADIALYSAKEHGRNNVQIIIPPLEST
ncbi:diguanylate cyclase with PAS/PAC sensor [Sulfuricurvum kujiense DSM 16994]|uniref:diguanylate cyclase n=1 Tax=Sulfuricurvum kujiense (strain ATCC BAA-921 / DSM 16994 / JCM 11577 / YK-1) TaxID=709032 RepID=E4U0L6_SULKY|nr:diguanylate cyclase [Sulfuricurvum kujiense]ADR34333.1 diguanylate cyclase with PAS/PAC sensor [Sulfuricurvum kujiense DSM 16994]